MIPISVCIITKNEAAHLDRCLSRIAPYPFELVVVDTGSTDNSKEVAMKYTDKVYDYVWKKDFSAARNFSISKASHDWILVLDTDEFVEKLDLESIYTLMQEHPYGIGRLLRRSTDANGSVTVDRVERLFHRQFYHYERPVHEQVTRIPQPDNAVTLGPAFLLPLEVEHAGYSGSEEDLAAKAGRDLEILLQHEAEYPDAYTYFQIGQCYYLIKDYQSAEEAFQKALSFPLDFCAEFPQMLVTEYGYCLYHLGRLHQAFSFLEPLEVHLGGYADYQFLLGFLYMETGRTDDILKAALHFIQATNCHKWKTLGSNSFLAYYNLGILYEMIGNREMAILFHQKAGDYSGSIERLKLLLQTD